MLRRTSGARWQALVLVAVGAAGLHLWLRSDKPTHAQAQTITVRPRAVGPNPTMGSPGNAIDPNGSATHAGSTQWRICKVNCAPSNQTATATWNDVLNGYRPIRLEVHWKAVPIISLFGSATASVQAKLEIDVGKGWDTQEQHTWTANQLGSNCPNPSNQTIQCGDHVTTVNLQPTQSTGAIQVRATLTSDLLTCNNCIPNTGDPSQAGGQIWVNDIRVIAEIPTLTVNPATPIRGETATFEVLGAPAATIDNWQFSTPTLGTVVRTTGTANTTWSGTLVATGTGTVRVVLLGTTYNLSKDVAVQPRNWTWTRKTPVHSDSLVEMPQPPEPDGPVGYYTLYMGYWFASWEIADDGPNDGFKYVTVLTEQAPGGEPHSFYYQIHAQLSMRVPKILITPFPEILITCR